MDKILSIVVGIITAAVLFKYFFKDRDDFIECVKFWLTPDIISAFRGEYFDDYWAEFKLLIWGGISAAMTYGTYQALI